MADSTLSRLVQLISSSDALELRRAAVQVAGSIGAAKERGLVQSLVALLEESDVDLRLAAVEALGKLGAEEALPPLIDLAREGGAEMEAAVAAASRLGARGVKAMGKLMDEATPAQRSRMAAVLARSGTGTALVVTAHALLDPDPKVVDAATRSLVTEVPSFSPAQRQALAKFLLDSLQAKKRSFSAKTEAAMLRVLGTLHAPKVEEVFWSRLEARSPPEVRAAALHALSNQAAPPSDARLARLLECAADSDFQIVAHALMLLKNVPASQKNVKHWLKLLDARDVATRRFAVDKLRDVESAEVARGLLPQLAHPDRALRDDALKVLLRFSKGRLALTERLLEAGSPDEAWNLARALAPAAKEVPAALHARLFETACRYHDAEDRRASPLWFLLREIDPAGARDRIEEKALALRKKKNYAAAVSYFRLLAHDPACREDIRLELAATGLKESQQDLSHEARAADPSLNQFSRLLQNPALDVVGRLAKAKWLEPADLFYLGFHFVEQRHREKDFGRQILEMVIQRSPKSELAKSARKKLRSEGAA